MDYNPIVKCQRCGTFIHIERVRFCCGYDYLLNREMEEVSRSRRSHPGKRAFDKNGHTNTRTKRKSRRQRSVPAAIRQRVLERDGHKCVKCKSTEKLQVHHIWHNKFGGGFDLSNLETLCLRCHIAEHKDEPVANLMRKTL